MNPVRPSRPSWRQRSRQRCVLVKFAGVITTPGVAYLTRTGDFAAGMMISASHNPFEDNGIKVFARTGYKLPDAEEHDIEEEIFRILPGLRSPVAPPLAETFSRRPYLDFLLSTLSTLLDRASGRSGLRQRRSFGARARVVPARRGRM